MKFILALTGLAAFTSAAVVKRGEEEFAPFKCPGTTQGACCQLDVDGVADLNCALATSAIYPSIDDFKAECAETGRTGVCCTLVVGSDGVLCSEP